MGHVAGTEIILKSDVAKRLLPSGYKGKINLDTLADQVNDASRKGNQSLTKLKEATSGGYLSQLRNSTDINACVRDSLEAISTLSKAQIALQAITAEINQETLNEQKRIDEQQHQLSSQQSILAKHSKRIEELVLITDQTGTIGLILDDIEAIRKIVDTVDVNKFGEWQQSHELKIESLHRDLNEALKSWINHLTGAIEALDVKSEGYFKELHSETDVLRTDLAINTQNLTGAIEALDVKSEGHFKELHSETDVLRTDLAESKSRIEDQRIKMQKYKYALFALSLIQLCVLVYLAIHFT